MSAAFNRAAFCREIAPLGGAAAAAKVKPIRSRIRRDAQSGCWFLDSQKGRPKVQRDGKTRYAVHVLYEEERGPIPDGAVLDHVTCDNYRCINPWHVEPRTQAENVLRGDSPQARNARKTHCPRGHSLADAYEHGHRRRCRQCTLERNRTRRARS